MATSFLKPIDPLAINENPFKLLGLDWMLITAGTMDSFNTMTASWGGFGVLWGKNVCFCFIRPSRYTHEFVQMCKTFSLSFFNEKYRKALEYCGKHSGRDVNKIKETGLTPVASENDTIYFEEARFVFECKKIYFDNITSYHFLDKEIETHYQNGDYHDMFIGEIIKCLRQ